MQSTASLHQRPDGDEKSESSVYRAGKCRDGGTGGVVGKRDRCDAMRPLCSSLEFLDKTLGIGRFR